MNPLMTPDAVPEAPPPEDLPLLVPHVRVLAPLFVDPAHQGQAWTQAKGLKRVLCHRKALQKLYV